MPLLPDNLDFSQQRCTAQESTLAGTRSLVLDNGVLRLSVLPEYGGRLCSLFYRPLNIELLATEFRLPTTGGTPGQRNTMNIFGGWCAAFPSLLADGEIISRIPWQGEIADVSDEKVVVRLHCLVERVSHMVEGRVRVSAGTILVERFIRLQVGEAAVMVEDVLTNRNIWPMATTWAAMVSLRAQAGDRVVLPVESVEVQRGVGPSGNELDFGLLVSTPYQVMARDLPAGWLGYRLASAPVDVRLTFPQQLLPHAVIIAQHDEHRPAEDAFRFQPMATTTPIAEDVRGGALLLPPKQPVRLPIRMEVGEGLVTAGQWSRPGLQMAQMITAQPVPLSRVSIWRVGQSAIALKTRNYITLLMPEFDDDALFTPEDLPAADFLLFSDAPSRQAMRLLVQRTKARFIGPASVRQMLRTDGVGDDRSVALSPGARIDFPGMGILATPARANHPEERLGYFLQLEHLSIYHAGVTQFLGEFGMLGEQFHPQLVFLPIGGELSLADAVHAAKQLKPRVVIPLGDEEVEREFEQRCRAQHAPFAVNTLRLAEGRLFDGWHLQPLG